MFDLMFGFRHVFNEFLIIMMIMITIQVMVIQKKCKAMDLFFF